jgi:arylsulfatase A-like enzyme
MNSHKPGRKRGPAFFSPNPMTFHSAFFLVALLGLAVSAAARTVLLDFNNTSAADETTNPSGGLFYNNVNLPSGQTTNGAVMINGAASLVLTDDAAAATPWSLGITKGGTGGVGASGTAANYAGPYPAAVGNHPASALRDGLYVNNAATLTLTFSGLDVGKAYDLLTYGARGNSGTSQPYTLVAGASSSPASVSFNPLNNAVTTPAWTAVRPAAGGVISLEINAAGSTSTVQALNLLSLAETMASAPPVISSFTVNDAYVSPGASATLSWQVTGADSLSISPEAGTANGPSGSLAVTVAQTTTYTLTATNSQGTSTATVRVAAGPERPNVMLVLVDDMGAMDTSVPFVYHNGVPVVTPLNQRYRTPHMEALAARGMRFTNASACTVCSPSRTSLMTGKNATAHHVTTWTALASPADTGDAVTAHNLLAPSNWAKGGTDPNGQTLPRLLKNAGYRTIHVGKGHFGPNIETISDPRAIGFDVNIAGSGLGGPGSYLGTQNFVKSNPSFQVPGMQSYWGQNIFLTEALTQEAKRETENAVASGAPFFMYLSHYAVHATFEDADPRFSANYPTLSGFPLNFATLVEGMDKSLGDMIQKLKDLGVAKNTLVVFVGDNGTDSPISMPSNGIGPAAPYRGKKGYAYEGGTRVPLIIGWAENDSSNPFQQALPIPGGSACHDITAIWDLFPTLLGATGITASEPVDGFDLRPYLRAEPGTHRPQEFLLNFPHSHEYEDFFAIHRTGNLKLIYRYKTQTYEMYDLATDIGEQNNLAANPTVENAKALMTSARKMIRGLVALDYQAPRDRLTAGNPTTPPIMPALATVDTDGDGIPDNTEDPNLNGLLDPGETDPDNPDSDGDGTADGAEVRLGLDPLDASSRFLARLEQLPGKLELIWPSMPGTFFSIYSSGNLTDWPEQLSTGFPAAPEPARSTSYEIPITPAGPRFFRIGLE